MQRWLTLLVIVFLAGCGETVAPTAVPTNTPTPLTSAQIIEHFKTKGLEVGQTYTMKAEDYKVDMTGHEGTGFYIPSLCDECGGRVIVVNDPKSFQLLRDYYVNLGKDSPLFFSWVYTKDNVILQINGDLAPAKAAGYGDALGSIPGTETASSLMMEKPTPRPTNTPKPTAKPTSTPKPTVTFEGYENPIPASFEIPIIGEAYAIASDGMTDLFLVESADTFTNEVIGRSVTTSNDSIIAIQSTYQVELDKLGWIKVQDESDEGYQLTMYQKVFSGEPLTLLIATIDRNNASQIDDRLILLTLFKAEGN